MRSDRRWVPKPLPPEGVDKGVSGSAPWWLPVQTPMGGLVRVGRCEPRGWWRTPKARNISTGRPSGWNLSMKIIPKLPSGAGT
jgi:hypothetical protein